MLGVFRGAACATGRFYLFIYVFECFYFLYFSTFFSIFLPKSSGAGRAAFNCLKKSAKTTPKGPGVAGFCLTGLTGVAAARFGGILVNLAIVAHPPRRSGGFGGV